MAESLQDAFDLPPFDKGDRVIIDYPENEGYHGVHGRVMMVRYKRRPKWGKTPGWWADVLLDPPKGVKRWTLEIHANHIQPEYSNEPDGEVRYGEEL